MSTDIVISSVQEMMSSQELIEVRPEELDDADALLVWSVFDALEKELIKKRKDAFRQYLLELATSKGIQNPKGSYEYAPPGTDGKITKQRRKGKAALDPHSAEVLLEKKHLDDSLMVGSVKLTRGQFKLLFDVIGDRLDEQKAADCDDGSIAELDELLDVFEEVYESKLEIDVKRFEAAVEMGTISLDELKGVSEVGDPTWALVIKKPSVITKLLKGGKK